MGDTEAEKACPDTHARAAKLPKTPGGKEEFLSAFSKLSKALLDDPLIADPLSSSTAARTWVSEMLEYNVPGGKLNRGVSVVDTVRVLIANGVGKERVNGEGEAQEGVLFQAKVVGWCIEWLQAFFLVADDIMDGSVTRRGQPCWYRYGWMIECSICGWITTMEI